MMGMRVEQQVIEEGNRMRVGLWLREHGSIKDRVYLEPVGYIGYFSGLEIMDFPGLVCPKNTECIRAGKTFTTIPEVTKPEWIVLRTVEADAMSSQGYFAKEYELAQTLNVASELRRHEWIPGVKSLLVDSVFLVYRRRR
jgi:hypothetical protein